MTNENNGDGHENLGAFGDNDPTKVELGDGLVIGSGRRLAEALLGSGRGVHAALDVVESSPGRSAVPALDEIESYLRRLVPIIQGQQRAVRRLRANVVARERMAKGNGNGHGA